MNGELIIQLSKETDPARRTDATGREAELMAAIAVLSTLPVPEVVFADTETGALATSSCPGTHCATVRWPSRHIPVEARRTVEDFLGRTPPAEPRTASFCHNDLGSEHVLVDAAVIAEISSGDTADVVITGVIDWTDAAIADPAHHLALIYRDLGPDVFDRTLAHYGGLWGDVDRDRAVFYARCALVEVIAYGVSTGARRYAQAGIAHLAWTFG